MTAAFAELGLAAPFVRAVAAEGYETPTPIQAQSIPHVLAGKDLLGCAQTGTGKTAAFVLPLLQRLVAKPRNGKIRCLVLAPTRELAAQIDERVEAYGKHAGLRHVCIYGGVGQRPQEVALGHKPDVLVATPGRLLDLMEQGFVKLDGVEIFVLDEADRMLDMGFIHDVRRVVKAVPTKRQTLLFSATIPADIADLARSILVDPVKVSVTPTVTTAEKIDAYLYFVEKHDKKALLVKLLRDENALRTIVFTRTKHGANRLAEQLTKSGIDSAAIHGNKSQGARERALEGFKRGTISVLVATDLAARGIDVEGITHVVNYELPNVPEQYVHRIGRTARAGAEGKAIAFCADDERKLLADIERFIRAKIRVAGAVRPTPRDAQSQDADRREPRGSQAHSRNGHGHAQSRSAHGQAHGHAQPRSAHGQAHAPSRAAHAPPRDAQAQPRDGQPRPAAVNQTAGDRHPNEGGARRPRRRRRCRGARLPAAD